MTHIIIDRTVENKNKSSTNRAKFTRRASERIKEAVKDYISNDADIKSISDNKSKKVKVAGKTLKEPQITLDRFRDRRQVVIGNKDFVVGDTVPKPKSSDAAGNTGGPSDSDEDDFYFNLTHKEFLDIFFEGLELPDLVKKQLLDEADYIAHRAGYTSSGSPARLDLRKTLVNSFKRAFAVDGSIQTRIEELEKELETVETEEEAENIRLELEELRESAASIPFLEERDLRYRHIEMVPQPVTKAVMFCILDVSGSMTSWHKETAKRFFMILYLFLTKQYENVEIVFIKHHHEAFEVSEHDFFYSRENGGTIVSKALELTHKIIKTRYPTALYNSYVCQMSDGDNWEEDGELAELNEHMSNILPLVQYFAFVDVKSSYPFSLFSVGSSGSPTTLMKQYVSIRDGNYEYADKFALRSINDTSDVYQVFRSLFEKYTKEKS